MSETESNGAEEGIRTPTGFLPPAPQAGASAVSPLPRGRALEGVAFILRAPVRVSQARASSVLVLPVRALLLPAEAPASR